MENKLLGTLASKYSNINTGLYNSQSVRLSRELVSRVDEMQSFVEVYSRVLIWAMVFIFGATAGCVIYPLQLAVVKYYGIFYIYPLELI